MALILRRGDAAAIDYPAIKRQHQSSFLDGLNVFEVFVIDNALVPAAEPF